MEDKLERRERRKEVRKMTDEERGRNGYEEGGRTGEAESHSKMQLRKWVEKEWETLKIKKGEVILRQKPLAQLCSFTTLHFFIFPAFPAVVFFAKKKITLNSC